MPVMIVQNGEFCLSPFFFNFMSSDWELFKCEVCRIIKFDIFYKEMRVYSYQTKVYFLST